MGNLPLPLFQHAKEDGAFLLKTDALPLRTGEKLNSRFLVFGSK